MTLQVTGQLDGRSQRRVNDARLALRLLRSQGWASDHKPHKGRRAARYRAQRLMRALEDFEAFGRGELREKTWYQDDGWDPPGWRWAIIVRGRDPDSPPRVSAMFDGRSQRRVDDAASAAGMLVKRGRVDDDEMYRTRRAARYRAQRLMRSLEDFKVFERRRLSERTWKVDNGSTAPGWRWAVIVRDDQRPETP